MTTPNAKLSRHAFRHSEMPTLHEGKSDSLTDEPIPIATPPAALGIA